MLDSKGFDLWADGYDKATGVSDEENTYPFAGYKNILGDIFDTIMKKPHARILDIGFGTAVLTSKLYENGCEVSGVDFSEKMIAIASAKMPHAGLYCCDFSKGFPEELTAKKFDFIIATYSLHHLEDDEKVPFLKTLRGLLETDGKILIGDVAFETREDLERCALETGDAWDEEERYFAVDELRESFPDLEFHKTTYCSGIIELGR